MKQQDVPVPKFNFGDTVKFNRSKDEDHFKDEGDLFGRIHLIVITMCERTGNIVQYYTEHDDNVDEDKIICRMVPETKAVEKPARKQMVTVTKFQHVV